MLNSFPEIHAFFKRDRFDSDDLGRLKQLIIERYLDKDLRKKANSFLALELLKFNILQEHPEQRQAPVAPKIENKSQKKFHSQEVKVPRRKIQKPLIQITYETTFPANFENLCTKLSITKIELAAICAKKDISLKGKTKFSEVEHQKLIPLFQKRLGEIWAIDRKEAAKKQVKKQDEANPKFKRRVSSFRGDVFDEIAKHGLGKLIYIRSR